VITLKYVRVLLRLDNDSEGGVQALTAPAHRVPQPGADELNAVAEMNTVPVQSRRDHQAFVRYWLFGLAVASRD